MCIIAVKKTGQKMFPEETIRMMFDNNPDGAGIMWYDLPRKKVGYRKGFMKLEQLMEFINGRDWTNTAVVMHFRIGTSGHKTKLCTHPYPVYDKNHVSGFTDIAVCHNGVLSNYFPGYNSAINDSLNFTQKVLSKLQPSFIRDKDKLMLIEELIGTSKLAFIDDSGDITLLGDFIEDDGYIYSNRSYLPKKPKVSYSFNSRNYYPSNLFGQWDDDDDKMDEEPLKSPDHYFDITEETGYQGETGDYAY